MDAVSPCCLILEDEGVIALALKASLEDAGFRVAGPFNRNAAALAWLDAHTPDLALIDILLRDGPCTPVMRALRTRNIPFAIYSGLKPANLHSELGAVRWLEKPVSRADLTSVLREIAPKRVRDSAPAPCA